MLYELPCSLPANSCKQGDVMDDNLRIYLSNLTCWKYVRVYINLNMSYIGKYKLEAITAMEVSFVYSIVQYVS